MAIITQLIEGSPFILPPGVSYEENGKLLQLPDGRKVPVVHFEGFEGIPLTNFLEIISSTSSAKAVTSQHPSNVTAMQILENHREEVHRVFFSLKEAVHEIELLSLIEIINKLVQAQLEEHFDRGLSLILSTSQKELNQQMIDFLIKLSDKSLTIKLLMLINKLKNNWILERYNYIEFFNEALPSVRFCLENLFTLELSVTHLSYLAFSYVEVLYGALLSYEKAQRLKIIHAAQQHFSSSFLRVIKEQGGDTTTQLGHFRTAIWKVAWSF